MVIIIMICADSDNNSNVDKDDTHAEDGYSNELVAGILAKC